MPIDLERAVGAPLTRHEASWDEDRVILYHLGVGAGEQPTEPNELEYVYEKVLKVLPTFGIGTTLDTMFSFTDVPGIDIDLAKILHGEHDFVVHAPVPARADVVHTGRVAAIRDKGAAALIELDIETRDAGTDVLLFTNRYSIFARGEGGFGGERGASQRIAPPETEPTAVVETRLAPQVGLIYRLTGDRHPAHIDPELARAVGFPEPILPGLCTFGAVCKAVVDGVLGGDVTRVTGFRGRFSDVVYPGDALRTSAWRENERVVVRAEVQARGTTVLSNAELTVRA